MTVFLNQSNSNSLKYFSPRKARRAAGFLLQELGLSACNLSISLTDDNEVQALNSTYRHKNKPTNVLSFPFAEAMETEMASQLPEVKELGDIVISLDTAYREAISLRQTPQKRLNWLIVHGLLHLIGYDHERSETEAKKMYDREIELLDKINRNRSIAMPELAINVDHVATIRQARGGSEPDPVTAAAICELAGASGIVTHLREDRRHVQDRDIRLLRQTVKTRLNLEMGANREIIDIALDLQPDMVTLVPEKRQELTTEGGLDVAGQQKKLTDVIKEFSDAAIPVSLFIDPDETQVKASLDAGATFVEIHTGRYSDAANALIRENEFALVAKAAEKAYSSGLFVNAGHGLDYNNTEAIAALDTIGELSIGHAVMARAIFTGLDKAVRDMLEIIRNAS